MATTSVKLSNNRLRGDKMETIILRDQDDYFNYSIIRYNAKKITADGLWDIIVDVKDKLAGCWQLSDIYEAISDYVEDIIEDFETIYI